METKNDFAQRYEQEKQKAAFERAYWLKEKVSELATDFAQKFGLDEESESYNIAELIETIVSDWAEEKAIDFNAHIECEVRPNWLEPDGTVRL